MMTVAQSMDGKLVQACDAESGKDYRCLRCNRIVRVHKTKYGWSFYHLGYRNHYSTNEGWFHQSAKQMLIDWGKKEAILVELEKVVGNQRADLRWGENKIFEIQDSPISNMKLKERHQGYHQKGWSDYWFVGPRFYYCRKNYNKMVHYHPRLGCHLWEIHPESQQIHLYYHLTSMRITTKRMIFNQVPTNFPVVRRKKINVANIVSWRLRQIKKKSYYHDSDLNQLIAHCYQSGLPFWETLPWFLIPVGLPYPNLVSELKWKYECVFGCFGDTIEETFPLIEHHRELLQQNFQYQLKIQGQNGYNFLLSPAFLKFENSFI